MSQEITWEDLGEVEEEEEEEPQTKRYTTLNLGFLMDRGESRLPSFSLPSILQANSPSVLLENNPYLQAGRPEGGYGLTDQDLQAYFRMNINLRLMMSRRDPPYFDANIPGSPWSGQERNLLPWLQNMNIQDFVGNFIPQAKDNFEQLLDRIPIEVEGVSKSTIRSSPGDDIHQSFTTLFTADGNSFILVYCTREKFGADSKTLSKNDMYPYELIFTRIRAENTFRLTQVIIVTLRPFGPDIATTHDSYSSPPHVIFHIQELGFDLPSHVYVPQYRRLNKEEKEEVLRGGKKIKRILTSDPVVKYYNWKKGDVVMSIRDAVHLRDRKEIDYREVFPESSA